jgi:hypothetical protein
MVMTLIKKTRNTETMRGPSGVLSPSAVIGIPACTALSRYHVATH